MKERSHSSDIFVILKNHIEFVDKVLKPFNGSICNYKTAYKNDLKKHIERDHKLLCDYEAAIKSDLNRHEESIHQAIQVHQL